MPTAPWKIGAGGTAPLSSPAVLATPVLSCMWSAADCCHIWEKRWIGSPTNAPVNSQPPADSEWGAKDGTYLVIWNGPVGTVAGDRGCGLLAGVPPRPAGT